MITQRRKLLSPGAGEAGYTMFVVVGVMFTIMTLTIGVATQLPSAPGFGENPDVSPATGDLQGARYDQDQKRAYAAAEAGVQDYLSRLNRDNTYWTKCDEPAPEPVNQQWDGTGSDPRVKKQIPGTDASYALELLPAVDPNTKKRQAKCLDSAPGRTMIDVNTGTFQIRSTGFVKDPDRPTRDVRRSIIATFRKRGFLDFLYFTDLETANPVTYAVQSGGNPTDPDVQAWVSDTANGCTRYYRDGRGSARYTGQVEEGNGTRDMAFNCTEINFVDGDQIKGPLHTNDELLVCNDPIFGRGPQDRIEVSGDPGWRGNGGCGGNSPVFLGKYTPEAPLMSLPPSNSKLKTLTDPAYIFRGRTTIKLAGNNIQVNGSLKPFPPNGIVYVENDPNDTCTFYDPTDTAAVQPGCGDALVEGPYADDLTIAAEADVIVTANITRAGDTMLGLIANNFVRVNHPVRNRNSNWNGSFYRWNCENDGSSPGQIDAAILALKNSFIVDNWYCGNELGTLTVNGAIAQKYRGIVGTFGSQDTGYKKNYVYDDRLRYREPPHFLDPVQTRWRVMRQTEQTPAR